jgi:Flp pilus assembly pilin Flp
VGSSTTQNPKEIEMTAIKNFINDESGMETLEYALIAGLIAIVAIFVYNSSWKTSLFNRLVAAATTS